MNKDHGSTEPDTGLVSRTGDLLTGRRTFDPGGNRSLARGEHIGPLSAP